MPGTVQCLKFWELVLEEKILKIGHFSLNLGKHISGPVFKKNNKNFKISKKKNNYYIVWKPAHCWEKKPGNI